MDKECNPSAHNHVIERINRNETRLNKHSAEIDELKEKQSAEIAELKEKQSAFDARLEHLIKSIEDLSKAIWWAIGLGGTTLVGFFIRIIERGLFQ